MRKLGAPRGNCSVFRVYGQKSAVLVVFPGPSMITSDMKVGLLLDAGTPAVQLPALLQLPLTAPVQVVCAHALIFPSSVHPRAMAKRRHALLLWTTSEPRRP